MRAFRGILSVCMCAFNNNQGDLHITESPWVVPFIIILLLSHKTSSSCTALALQYQKGITNKINCCERESSSESGFEWNSICKCHTDFIHLKHERIWCMQEERRENLKEQKNLNLLPWDFPHPKIKRRSNNVLWAYNGLIKGLYDDDVWHRKQSEYESDGN